MAGSKFTVVAAQNPYDDVGTVRISRAFMDRICRITLDYQTEAEEIEIVKNRTGLSDDNLVLWAVKLTRQSRSHDDIKMGASVRAAIDIVALSESMKKRGAFTRDNVKEAVFMALSSKICLTEMTPKTPEHVIREIINVVEQTEGISYFPAAGQEEQKPQKKKAMNN